MNFQSTGLAALSKHVQADLLAKKTGIKPINLVLIVTPEMGEVPPWINVVQEFGQETIVAGPAGSERTTGRAMLVQGSEDTLMTWLRPFKEVWTSNSPMTGEWQLQEVAQGVVT